KEVVEIIFCCMDLDLALRIKKVISTLENFEENQSATKFFEEIEQFFVKNEKAKTSNLLTKVISMKYKGKGNIREYIMEMSNLTPKLKSLKLEFGEDFLVYLVLISLLAYFRDKIENVHFGSTAQNKKKKNIKDVVEWSSQQKKPKKDEEFTYYFYKKLRHMKKHYSKIPDVLKKELLMEPTTRGYWNFHIIIKNWISLDLSETFVVLSFKPNLISISSLDKIGFSCSFGNNKVSLYQNSNTVGSSSVIDNLYMLDVASSYNEIPHTSS
ncbi:hypothetical protein CR513_44101, partial [Mucuna pruriens]